MIFDCLVEERFFSFATPWKTNNLPEKENNRGNQKIPLQHHLLSQKLKRFLSQNKMIPFLKLFQHNRKNWKKSENNLKKLKKSKMSKKLLSKRPKSLKRFIKLRRNLRQLWYWPKAKLKLLQKLILLELLKHNNYLFIEKKEKLQRKMPHQSIKLRDQILVETRSTKEDLILLGVLMMNKIKILINVSLKKEN